MGYAGFFHFDLIASLKESDISMHDDHMYFREGVWLPYAHKFKSLYSGYNEIVFLPGRLYRR